MELQAIRRRSSHILVSGLPLVIVFLAMIISVAAGDQVLYPTNSLFTGQSLNVNNYALAMQPDCNLVLYDGNRAVWATSTNGRGSSCRVTMQRDGNLVVYDGNGGAAVWASGTAREQKGNYALVLQRDRNLVIYGPAIWASGTNAAGVDEGAVDGPFNIPKDAVLLMTSHGRAVLAAGAGVGSGRKVSPGHEVAGDGSNVN